MALWLPPGTALALVKGEKRRANKINSTENGERELGKAAAGKKIKLAEDFEILELDNGTGTPSSQNGLAEVQRKEDGVGRVSSMREWLIGAMNKT